MTNKIITFWNAVKLIHPDLNPEIQDPSEKMDSLIFNRGDESELYKLCVLWGLIDDPEITNFTPEYSLEPGKYIKINDIKGIIVDVIELNDKTKVIVWIEGSYKKYMRNNNWPQDKDFYVTGYCNENDYMKIDMKYQTFMMSGAKI